MAVTADEVARLCLDTYAALPKRGKPGQRSNGAREHTVLAGFVLTSEGAEPLCASLGYLYSANDAPSLAILVRPQDWRQGDAV
jgi:hypothetical protein